MIYFEDENILMGLSQIQGKRALKKQFQSILRLAYACLLMGLLETKNKVR